jgi:hypothetical protein
MERKMNHKTNCNQSNTPLPHSRTALALVPTGGSYGTLFASHSFCSLTTRARVPVDGKLPKPRSNDESVRSREAGTGVLRFDDGGT